ncbi:MBL fold metallo-hydrolase [Sinorhizobium meliloti]|nr:MBL fold metallo-hydrolase [Sinorhizobium meliloti]
MLQAGIIPVTHFEQNCTVLFDSETKEGVVVDPGGDVDIILQTIRENGIALKAIWLTHGHIDHAGGAKELKEALGARHCRTPQGRPAAARTAGGSGGTLRPRDEGSEPRAGPLA